jgi:hypothetical protein
MEDAIICLTAEVVNEVKNNLASFAMRLDEKTVQADLIKVLI